MFEFYRLMHIVGVAMFFGSVLAHVTAGWIPGASDDLAAREDQTGTSRSPGSSLYCGRRLMIANAGYLKRRRVVVHIAAVALIAVIGRQWAPE